MMFRRPVLALLFLGTVGSLVSGCGKNSSVTIQSGGFNTSGATANAVMAQTTTSTTPATPVTVTDFKVCVARMKLENDNDEVEQKDGQDEFVFSPGLIDLTNGQAKGWGKVDVPTGFKLKRLKIKVRRDPELCQGADYSIKFNELTTRQDVEFKFRFDPPVDIKPGDTFTLGFQAVVDRLRERIGVNSLVVGDDLIKEVEGLEGKCEKN